MKTNDAANHVPQRQCLVACRVCVQSVHVGEKKVQEEGET